MWRRPRRRTAPLSCRPDPHAGRIRPCRCWAKCFGIWQRRSRCLWWPILIMAIRLKTVDLRSTAASPQLCSMARASLCNKILMKLPQLLRWLMRLAFLARVKLGLLAILVAKALMEPTLKRRQNLPVTALWTLWRSVLGTCIYNRIRKVG